MSTRLPNLFPTIMRLELELKGPTEKVQTRTKIVPEGDFCTWFATGAAYFCDMIIWREVGGFDENLRIIPASTSSSIPSMLVYV